MNKITIISWIFLLLSTKVSALDPQLSEVAASLYMGNFNNYQVLGPGGADPVQSQMLGFGGLQYQNRFGNSGNFGNFGNFSREGNYVNPRTFNKGGYGNRSLGTNARVGKAGKENKGRGNRDRDRGGNGNGGYYDGGFDDFLYSDEFDLPGYGRYGNYDSYRYYGPGENPETAGLYGYGYDYDYPVQPLPPLQGMYYGGDAYGNGGPGYGAGYGTYQPLSGMSVRYGDGGFGDPNFPSFNPRACTQKGQKDCTDGNPDRTEQNWRFIKDIGWRKMDNYGAARKDWWDYKSSVPLPFNFYNFPRFTPIFK